MDTPIPGPPQDTDEREAFVRAIGTTLLDLLDNLVEPVIPFALHARCAGIVDREAAFEVRVPSTNS